MRTRRDLQQRVVESLGLVRDGASIPADMYRSNDARILDFLLELDADPRGPLDFDPLASDEIPDERMSLLTGCCAGIIASKYGLPFDLALWERAKSQLFAAIIGPSDYIEDEPRDF